MICSYSYERWKYSRRSLFAGEVPLTASLETRSAIDSGPLPIRFISSFHIWILDLYSEL